MAVTGKPQRQRNDVEGVSPRGRPVRIEARGGLGRARKAICAEQTHTIGSASLVAAVAGREARLVRLGAATRLSG
jgi:hypothetical protein